MSTSYCVIGTYRMVEQRPLIRGINWPHGGWVVDDVHNENLTLSVFLDLENHQRQRQDRFLSLGKYVSRCNLWNTFGRWSVPLLRYYLCTSLLVSSCLFPSPNVLVSSEDPFHWKLDQDFKLDLQLSIRSLSFQNISSDSKSPPSPIPLKPLLLKPRRHFPPRRSLHSPLIGLSSTEHLSEPTSNPRTWTPHPSPGDHPIPTDTVSLLTVLV